MANNLMWCEDDDLEKFEESLQVRFPKDKEKPPGSWIRWRRLAMDEVERRLRAHRSTSDRFELGRVGLRSQEDLRDVVAWFALHFRFTSSDYQGESGNVLAAKAAHYFERATKQLEAEAVALDYDFSNDGIVSPAEEQRPFATRIVRG